MELPQLTAITCRHGGSARLQNHSCPLSIHSACNHTITTHHYWKLLAQAQLQKHGPFAAVSHISADAEIPLTIMNDGLSAAVLA